MDFIRRWILWNQCIFFQFFSGEYFEKVIFLLENPFERMKSEEQIKERNHLLFNDKVHYN